MTLLQQDGALESKLLLVEGNDDLRFFRAVSEYLGITDVVVSSYNGKSNLGNDLSELVRSPRFQTVSSLAIVRDADDSSKSAFDSIVGSLQRAKLPTPSVPITPVELDGLRISVLILPPDDAQGELENVCLRSVEGIPDIQCVESYFDCLGNLAPPIAANHIAKARLHSYLAIGPVHITDDGKKTRRRPALRLGEAAEAGVWDWSSHVFQEIKDFLHNM